MSNKRANGVTCLKGPEVWRTGGDGAVMGLKDIASSWRGTGGGGPDDIEEIGGDGIRQSLDV